MCIGFGQPGTHAGLVTLPCKPTHVAIPPHKPRLTMIIMFIGACLLTGAYGPTDQVFLSVFCFSLFFYAVGERVFTAGRLLVTALSWQAANS